MAVVAYNRRAVYANGHAEMYGKTDRPDFRGLEGREDNDVGDCNRIGTSQPSSRIRRRRAKQATHSSGTAGCTRSWANSTLLLLVEGCAGIHAPELFPCPPERSLPPMSRQILRPIWIGSPIQRWMTCP
jgi:hypothetical protein